MTKKVGVIGGGQLAWMMAMEAPKLDIELIVQASSKDDPAVKRATGVVWGEVDDADATAELTALCDAITFENEFINLPVLRELLPAANFRPSLDALTPLLDKYHQRNFLKQIGLPVPKFDLGLSQSELAAKYGFPIVLKARRHGYDGQGTFIIKDASALAALSGRIPIAELLVEEFIPFERELGIIAARNVAGEIAVYPVTETRQQDRVCHWTITPADVDEPVKQEVRAIARKILEELKVVGVFGIEFFLTRDRRVLVNEIAPRTHNSGHYSLDACETSQFAMQLRAVADLPLGSTALKSAGAVMVNLLGFEESNSDYRQQRDRISTIPHSFVHWYGKTSRLGRKLGHVTVLLDSEQLTAAKTTIEQIESAWYGKSATTLDK